MLPTQIILQSDHAADRRSGRGPIPRVVWAVWAIALVLGLVGYAVAGLADPIQGGANTLGDWSIQLHVGDCGDRAVTTSGTVSVRVIDSGGVETVRHTQIGDVAVPADIAASITDLATKVCDVAEQEVAGE